MTIHFFVLYYAPSLIGLLGMIVCWVTTKRLRWFCVAAGVCMLLFLSNDAIVDPWLPRTLPGFYVPYTPRISVPPSFFLVIWLGLILLRVGAEVCWCWNKNPQRFFTLVIIFGALLVISGAMWFIGVPTR